MKNATKIKKAIELFERYEALLEPIREELKALIDDDFAYVFWGTDGLTVAWGEGLNNSVMSPLEVEKLLNGTKQEALDKLDACSV